MKRLTHHLKEHPRIDYPHVRVGLEPFRYEDDKKQFFIGLKDPLELSDVVILLPQDLYYLLQFFDGRHSIDDLTSIYMRQFNTFLNVDRLKKLIKKMDDGLLLVNKRSEKRLQQIAHAFRQLPVRQPVCVGSSYAEEPNALKNELERYGREATSAVPVERFRDKHIKGMLLPHIDPRLGGPAYASAYNALEIARAVDLFVVLGISHQFTHQSFVMTDKDYSTPLGLVQTNKALVKKVVEQCTTDFRHDEIVHRDEHSIEFQTLFLKHVHKHDFKILPVLCSFSYNMSVSEREQFAEFTQAMRAVLSEYSGSICFVASVDFSHIGPHYGDTFTPDSFLLTKVEHLDKAILNSMAAQNKLELDAHFARSNNRYHICGYAAMRTLLEFLPPSHATLLTYENAIMDDQRSTVTFASMIFS